MEIIIDGCNIFNVTTSDVASLIIFISKKMKKSFKTSKISNCGKNPTKL
jgi:hypothetical protein